MEQTTPTHPGSCNKTRVTKMLTSTQPTGPGLYRCMTYRISVWECPENFKCVEYLYTNDLFVVLRCERRMSSWLVITNNCVGYIRGVMRIVKQK